jgi:tetratricopeptide (TPR) repeat protein
LACQSGDGALGQDQDLLQKEQIMFVAAIAPALPSKQRDEFLVGAVPTLAARFPFEQTHSMISAIGNPFQKAAALIAVGESFSENERGRAKSCYNETLDLVSKIAEPELQLRTMNRFLTGVSHLGYKPPPIALLERGADKALDTLKPVDQSQILPRFAEQFSRAGDLEHAAILIDKTLDTLPHIADPKLQFGAVKCAVGSVNNLRDEEHMLPVLAHSRNVILGTLQPVYQSRALTSLAGQYGRLGYPQQARSALDDALAIVPGIADPKLQFGAVKRVVGSVNNLKDKEHMLPVLAHSRDVILGTLELAYQSQALTSLAGQYGRLGYPEQANSALDDAFAIVPHIEDAERQSKVIGQIVGDVTNSDLKPQTILPLERNRRAVLEASNPFHQTQILSTLALRHIELGRTEQALTVLSSALGIVPRIEDSEQRFRAMDQIVDSITNLGPKQRAAPLVERSVDVASKNLSPNHQSRILASIIKDINTAGYTAELAGALFVKILEATLALKELALQLLDQCIAGIGKLEDKKQAQELLELGKNKIVETLEIAEQPRALTSFASQIAPLGGLAKAQVWFDEALDLAAQVGPVEQARVLATNAKILANFDAEKGVELIREAIQIAKTVSLQYDESWQPIVDAAKSIAKAEPSLVLQPKQRKVKECKDCHREYTVTLDEESRFQRRRVGRPSLSKSLRCPECRVKHSQRTWQLGRPNFPILGSRGGSGCFEGLTVSDVEKIIAWQEFRPAAQKEKPNDKEEPPEARQIKYTVLAPSWLNRLAAWSDASHIRYSWSTLAASTRAEHPDVIKFSVEDKLTGVAWLRDVPQQGLILWWLEYAPWVAEYRNAIRSLPFYAIAESIRRGYRGHILARVTPEHQALFKSLGCRSVLGGKFVELSVQDALRLVLSDCRVSDSVVELLMEQESNGRADVAWIAGLAGRGVISAEAIEAITLLARRLDWLDVKTLATKAKSIPIDVKSALQLRLRHVFGALEETQSYQGLRGTICWEKSIPAVGQIVHFAASAKIKGCYSFDTGSEQVRQTDIILEPGDEVFVISRSWSVDEYDNNMEELEDLYHILAQVPAQTKQVILTVSKDFKDLSAERRHEIIRSVTERHALLKVSNRDARYLGNSVEEFLCYLVPPNMRRQWSRITS